jgi:hypothetical protein
MKNRFKRFVWRVRAFFANGRRASEKEPGSTRTAKELETLRADAAALAANPESLEEKYGPGGSHYGAYA